MKTRNALVAAALMILFSVSHADTTEVALRLSSDFLSRLMSARASRTEIAVIHQEMGTALLVDAADPGKAVVYLSGRDNFVWSQIVDQLPAALSADKPMRLELETRKIEVRSCVSLDGKLAEFLKRVEESLANRRASPPDPEEIWTDAASFRIQLAASDGRLVIIPEGGSNPPLQRATSALHSVVSGCSNTVQPSLEQQAF